MSLDACVYCDCYEKGRLREPPPSGVSLLVEPDGSLGYQRGAAIDYLAWDQWREQFACEHPSGRLLHHRLGNISLIGMFRAELQREPGRFPILLTKVVYNGSHGGDFLPVEIVRPLQKELESLASFQCSSPETDAFMSQFRAQMSELVTASLSVNKPIAF